MLLLGGWGFRRWAMCLSLRYANPHWNSLLVWLWARNWTLQQSDPLPNRGDTIKRTLHSIKSDIWEFIVTADSLTLSFIRAYRQLKHHLQIHLSVSSVEAWSSALCLKLEFVFRQMCLQLFRLVWKLRFASQPSPEELFPTRDNFPSPPVIFAAAFKKKSGLMHQNIICQALKSKK